MAPQASDSRSGRVGMDPEGSLEGSGGLIADSSGSTLRPHCLIFLYRGPKPRSIMARGSSGASSGSTLRPHSLIVEVESRSDRGPLQDDSSVRSSSCFSHRSTIESLRKIGSCRSSILKRPEWPRILENCRGSKSRSSCQLFPTIMKVDPGSGFYIKAYKILQQHIYICIYLSLDLSLALAPALSSALYLSLFRYSHNYNNICILYLIYI